MRRFKTEMEGGELAGIEFGDPVLPYSALWIHATGFNAITYQSILAPLGLRTRIGALDMRGHGRTTLEARPDKLKSWTVYRDDVIAWLDRQAPGGLVLGGHSMGGTVALMVAGKRPDLVKGLVLADPVILSPRYYTYMHLFPLASLVMRNSAGMSRQARRRRNRFSSVDEARASYQDRGAFKTWREPFLSDYLLDGLQRIDNNPPGSHDQTWALACDPAWEAATFAAQRNRAWSALAKVKRRKIPILILRAEQGSVMTDRVAQRIQRKNPALVMKTHRGSTHFLPMEAPYEVRDQLSAFISRLVEGFSAGEEGPIPRTLAAN